MHRDLSSKWLLLFAAIVAWLLYAPTAFQFLYTHDGWNDVLLGQKVLAGGLPWTENIHRILPTLSFGVRGAAGLYMPAWHLPNIFLHGINAALVVLLAMRIGGNKNLSLIAGLLFATTPLISHTVEWIGGSYDLFATAGALGCILLVLSERHWTAALLALVASLSKESTLVLPAVLVILCFAQNGVPIGWKAIKQLIRRIGPSTGAIILCAVFRIIQIWYAPGDPLAGREPELDLVRLLVSAPAAAGVVVQGPIAQLIGFDSSTGALEIGYICLALALVGAVVMPHWRRQTLWLLVASALAVVPVTLISMDVGMMVENPRYLYLSSALAAPIVPGLLLTSARFKTVAFGLCGLLIVLAAYGTSQRIERSARQSGAVATIAEKLMEIPANRNVWIFSNLYDDATARLLMSRWLLVEKQLNTNYVMIGTWTHYKRHKHAGSDAANSYFGPRDEPFSPELIQPNDIVLWHTPVDGKIADGDTYSFSKEQSGAWTELEGDWVAVPSLEADDDLSLEQRTIDVRRFYGPVYQSDFLPQVLSPPLEAGDPLSGIELTLRMEETSKTRYGSSYHELWGAVFLKHQDALLNGIGFELKPKNSSQKVFIDLSFSRLSISPSQLGIIALNYPGRVTIERVRIRR